MNKKLRILIIGAGPAGLSTLKSLKQLSPSKNYEITCIQKQQNWGGQWNYSWRNGIDKYGQHIHSGMYSELWTNAPKECYQFPDYSLKQHYGQAVPSYLPRNIHKGYFMARFQKMDLKKYITFNTIARNIKFNNNNQVFQVRLTNLQKRSDMFYQFDYVVVAAGHYSYPNIPNIKGIQKFKGKIVHSHDVRVFDEFRNKNILIIGGGRSSEDLVGQCYKYGSKSIIWTYRRLRQKYNKQNIPSNIQMIPNLQYIGEDKAYFNIHKIREIQNNKQNKTDQDKKQQRQIDSIIYCTGYLHYFPYLQEQLRLQTKNMLWPTGLYKNCVWMNNPRLFYMGMGSYMLGQVIADIQSYFVRDVISKKYILPQFNELYYKRDNDDMQRQQQMLNAKSVIQGLISTVKYGRHMMGISDYVDFNIQGSIREYSKSIMYKNNDIINYRDHGVFRSNITGQQSINGNSRWIQMKQVQDYDRDSRQKLKEFFDFKHINQ